MEKQIVEFSDLGKMDYKAAWDYQDVLMQQNLALKKADVIGHPQNNTRHYLLLVEHLPVYTLGKSGKMEHVLINEEQRTEKGIDFYQTNRGGDITFHGPGQIVGYPILDLEKFYTDIGRYLRELEEVIILTLKEYGIEDHSKVLPKELFSIDALFTLRGLIMLVGGGFLVGFGARYAGGCTSGHSIMGISNLQVPSMIATAAFMAGGFLMANLILPFILKL